MKFEAGQLWVSRDNKVVAIRDVVDAVGERYPVRDTEGNSYATNGRYDLWGDPSPKDLIERLGGPREDLPAADDDILDENNYQCSVCESDWGTNRAAAFKCCSRHKSETQADATRPAAETVWDRDARAALTGIIASINMNTRSVVWADEARAAANAADALAVERARRNASTDAD